VLVLTRQRQARDGHLFITGRESEERKLQVTWDPAHLLWTISKDQDDPEATLSPEQRAVLAVVQAVLQGQLLYFCESPGTWHRLGVKNVAEPSDRLFD
jgi:hypothetical protein